MESVAVRHHFGAAYHALAVLSCMLPHRNSLLREAWPLLLAGSLCLVLSRHLSGTEPSQLAGFRRVLSVLVFFGTHFALRGRFGAFVRRMASFVEDSVEQAAEESDAAALAARGEDTVALQQISSVPHTAEDEPAPAPSLPLLGFYPPRVVLLGRREFSSIVRNWTGGLLLIAAALLAYVYFGAARNGEASSAGALLSLIVFSVASVCVLFSWTVWLISVNALCSAAGKLVDAFRRPDTMDTDSRGLPNVAAYLDWFRYLRGELHRTGEEMTGFAMCGIGGFFTLAFLCFAWAPQGDTATIWEGVGYLLFAVLLLAPAAFATSQFQMVLPALVQSLAAAPNIDLDALRAAAPGGDRTKARVRESGTAHHPFTVAARDHTRIIGFLLQTSRTSDALTCCGVPLSGGLLLTAGTVGAVALAVYLLG